MIIRGYNIDDSFFIKNTTLEEVVDALERAGISPDEWQSHLEDMKKLNKNQYAMVPHSTTMWLRNDDGLLEVHGIVGDKHV